MPYFDQISDTFLRNIYERPKGAIRLAILKRDLTPLLKKPLKILDIGGGAGQMALWYATQGHQVTLIDMAENLLEKAQFDAQNAGISQNMQIICDDVFTFTPNIEYDLVCCHAVLEWVEKKHELLEICRKNLKKDGFLSLMFYNKNALEFAQYVFGNFHYLERGFIAKRKSAKLTPNFPNDPQEINDILQDLAFKIHKKSNIRCFFDYMKPHDKERHSTEEIIERELTLADDERFINVARYLHYLGQKV